MNTLKITSLRTRIAFLLILVAMVVTFGAPGLAYSAQAPAPLVEDGIMQVMLFPAVDGSSTAVLVQYEIPSTTVLPARVRIPVPAQAHVGWVGEISLKTGPDTQRDYEIKNEGGREFVEFTLSESKTGQVDFSGLPLTNEKGALNARLEWEQSSAAKTTVFEVRLPSKVHDVKISPKPQGSPDKNEYGETLYSLSSRDMKIGEKETITVSYREGAGVGPFSSENLLIGLAAALGVVALVLIIFMIKRPKKRGE